MKHSRLENINKAHDAMIVRLLDWFAANKRNLPWRHDYDPYHVWVSEIMLQQTQMERGVQYFEAWLRRFPTVEDVARATEQEILLAWEGLGYYSRARNLHKAAKIIVQEYGGEIPDDPCLLRALPGIGEYTAGAIASIAFQKDVIAVDANVERVFSRIFDVAMPPKSPVAAGFIRQAAEALLPDGKGREFTQSLMEFGAMICKKKPLCQECPLQAWCAAYRLNIVSERPVRGKAVGTTSLQVVTGVIVHKGRVFIQKRLNTGGWAGLWEFPGGRVEPGEAPAEAIVREVAEETAFAVSSPVFLGTVSHSYTRYKIALHCFLCRLEDGLSGRALLDEHQPDNRQPDNGQSAYHQSDIPQYGEYQLDGQFSAGKPSGGNPIGEGSGWEGYPIPQLNAATAYAWEHMENLGQYPFPAPHRKMLDLWKEQIEERCRQTDEGGTRTSFWAGRHMPG